MGTIISVQDFNNSPYGGIADTVDSISAIILRAESYIQAVTNRTFGVASYTETHYPLPNAEVGQTRIFLRNRPIQSITTIQHRLNAFYDWDDIDPANFIIEAGPGYIQSYRGSYLALTGNQIFPLGMYDQFGGWEVQITYTAGTPDIPGAIKQAVMLQTVLFSYQDTQMYARTDDRDPGIEYMKKDIVDLVTPFIQTGLAYT